MRIDMISKNEYLIGFAGLGRLLESGVDFPLLGPQLQARVASDPSDANAMLDIATLLFLTANDGNRPFALDHQQRALTMRRVYSLQPPAKPALRLLALMAPGDMTSNTPVDCLLEGSDVALTLLYALPDRPLPPLPEHDVVFIAIGESTDNQILLRQLAELSCATSKPVINAPERVAVIVRNRASELLDSIPSVLMPATVQVERKMLLNVAQGSHRLDAILPKGRFPIIVRPLDSQGGKDLDRIDGVDDLAAYLARVAGDAFFVSNFIDYRSADGKFRKLRVVLVDGRPFAVHMGISSHWMIHYVNAGMDESAEKRREEEQFFATFDAEFATRHQRSLAAICERVGLDYFSIDCAEMPDGSLLIFEVDNAGIVHDFDDPKMFPYKPPAMRKIFAAFREMLAARASRPEGAVAAKTASLPGN
jgi:glutathione synthase/RimK-type ligase-like ATP-grasp enzyme